MADPTATNLFGVPLDQNSLGSLQQDIGSTGPAAQLKQYMGSRPQASHRYEEQSGKHKGAAGTARNVLGFLGDFLLKKIGMPAMYGPGEEERKLNAAWQGHEQDPQAALDRVTDVNYNAGIKQRDQYDDNQRLAAQQQSTAALRQERVDTMQEKTRTSVLDRTARYMNGIAGLPPEKRAEAYANGRKLWANSATVRGDPALQAQLDDFFPEKYDEGVVTGSIGQFVPVATQWNQAITSNRDSNNYEMAGKRDQTTRRGQDLSHTDRQAAEAGRTDRNTLNEGGRNERNTLNEGGRNDRTTTTEAGKDRRTLVKPPAQGRVVTLPDGRKVRIKG